MKIRLKLWYFNNKNIINTTKFLFISVIMLITVWFMDVRYPQLTAAMPKFMLLSIDVSKSFLATLSGVFLTVATFTFTTILTVLTTYNSSFTPRVVQKFINKPHVLSLIGIFIGGFFYTVLSLFILQDIQSGQRILAGSLGVGYAIASMVYFMLFVQQVIRDIKSANLIEDIFEEASALVEKEAEKRKNSQRLAKDKIGKTIPLYANQTGYFYEINTEHLLQLTKEIACEIVIHKKIGQYVSKGIYLADLNMIEKNISEKSVEDEDAFLEEIANCFILNRTKNDSRDYHQEIINLVEIALRAISPGINDPNTAINCVDRIANLLGQLFSTKNKFIVLKDSTDAKIIYITYSVEEELYLSFYQLIFYGKKDPSVAYAILEGLYLIYMLADDSAKESVQVFFEQTYEVTFHSMNTEMDKNHLQSIRQDFLENKDKQCITKKKDDGPEK